MNKGRKEENEFKHNNGDKCHLLLTHVILYSCMKNTPLTDVHNTRLLLQGQITDNTRVRHMGATTLSIASNTRKQV